MERDCRFSERETGGNEDDKADGEAALVDVSLELGSVRFRRLLVDHSAPAVPDVPADAPGRSLRDLSRRAFQRRCHFRSIVIKRHRCAGLASEFTDAHFWTSGGLRLLSDPSFFSSRTS